MSTEYLGVERAANNEVGSIVTEKWLRADECEHAIVVENGRVRWRGGVRIATSLMREGVKMAKVTPIFLNPILCTTDVILFF